MPYLLVSCPSTWDLLPSALKPMESQLQRTHNITISFLPVPILRTLLIRNPVDWIKFASQHDLRLQWPVSWGDVGGAWLEETGNWRQAYSSSSSFSRTRNHTDITPPADNLDGNKRLMLEAVVIDRSSGRRCISEDFEKHCWAQENWLLGKEVLALWPEIGRCQQIA